MVRKFVVESVEEVLKPKELDAETMKNGVYEIFGDLTV